MPVMVEGHPDGLILDGVIMHGGGGVKGDETAPPGKFLKNLLKNAIKHKKGTPPGNFFLKALTSPRDFGENLSYPLPWIFNS